MRQLACRVRADPMLRGVMLLTDARVVTPAGVLEPGGSDRRWRASPTWAGAVLSAGRDRPSSSAGGLGRAGLHRPARPRRRRPRDALGGAGRDPGGGRLPSSTRHDGPPRQHRHRAARRDARPPWRPSRNAGPGRHRQPPRGAVPQSAPRRRARPASPAGAGRGRLRAACSRRPMARCASITVAPELPGGLDLRRVGRSVRRRGGGRPLATPTTRRRRPPSTPARRS